MTTRRSIMVLLTATGIVCCAAWVLGEADKPSQTPQARGDANAAPATRPAGPTTAAAAGVIVDGGTLFPSAVVIPRQLTAQQEQEVLDYTRDKRPEIYQQIVQYRKTNRQAYDSYLRSMYAQMERYKRMPERLRNAYDQLQVANYTKLWQLARDIQATTDPAIRANKEAELFGLVSQRFEAEQVIREYRIEEIMERAKLLDKELKDRAVRGDTIKREMYEQFLKGAAAIAETPKTQPAGQPATQPADVQKN